MHNPSDSLQAQLFALQDIGYKDFNKKLIPTVDEKTMIGIRTPMLKALAKTLFKMNPDMVTQFLSELPHQYFEENNLHAFLIENFKDFDTALAQTERFLPFIDNWATCDSFAPPLFKKHPEEIYKKILQWIRSPHTYTVRYAIGLLLSNYLDAHFTPAMLELVAGVQSEEYYINMMIAWYFSFALIKQYDAAIPYITEQRLSPFTHNKTIQKAIESRRIPDHTKDYLRTLKIPQKEPQSPL